MRVVALTVPFDFVILINYISLAELVDKDNGAAVADSKLEDMIEDHHTDRAACVVTMVMDLLLIACSMFLAEACFELSRAFHRGRVGRALVVSAQSVNMRYCSNYDDYMSNLLTIGLTLVFSALSRRAPPRPI